MEVLFWFGVILGGYFAGFYATYRLLLWDAYLSGLRETSRAAECVEGLVLGIWPFSIWYVLGHMAFVCFQGTGSLEDRMNAAEQAGQTRRILAAEGRDPRLPIPHEDAL